MSGRNSGKRSGDPFKQWDPNQPKKPCLRAVKLTKAEKQKQEEEHLKSEKERREKKEKEAKERAEAEQRARDNRLKVVLEELKQLGYETLFTFLHDLFTTKDQHTLSQVTQMIGHHTTELLNFVQASDGTGKTGEWIRANFRAILLDEIKRVTTLLRPQHGEKVSNVLETFSLVYLLHNANSVAPNLHVLISDLLGYEEGLVSKKKKDVVLAAVLSILAQCHNEKASQVQTVTGIFLFACGASRAMFDVLNHAGFSLSYTQMLEKLNGLLEEHLIFIRNLVRSLPCMIVYNNVNIAFWMGEQHANSKDHFDHGTTATLVPLFKPEDEPGPIPLSHLPQRRNRRANVGFDPTKDLLPSSSSKQAHELQGCMLFHIEEILLDACPDLRARLSESESAKLKPPTVRAIPVHKTEQYPLSAALIDESTIDGTLNVINHVFFRTLKLTEDDIKQHGVFFVHSNQLTVSLLETAAGSRHDDTELRDNPSKYIKPVMGLFHAKVAGARCVFNKHFGVPRSLRKVIALLGWKMVCGGWKAKPGSLPSYRFTVRLVLRLALVANMLDGFRICCGAASLDVWVAGIKSHSDIHSVSAHVLRQLASSRRVEELQSQTVRDVILENDILFN